MPSLLDTLRALEVELHRASTRADRERMNALLHADFVEFGRSGTVWTRQATLDEFTGSAMATAPSIHAQDFELHGLGDDLALLTYRSAHVDSQGMRDRWTRRSSLWQRSGRGDWQMRFHQGTPSDNPAA